MYISLKIKNRLVHFMDLRIVPATNIFYTAIAFRHSDNTSFACLVVQRTRDRFSQTYQSGSGASWYYSSNLRAFSCHFDSCRILFYFASISIKNSNTTCLFKKKHLILRLQTVMNCSARCITGTFITWPVLKRPFLYTKWNLCQL